MRLQSIKPDKATLIVAYVAVLSILAYGVYEYAATTPNIKGVGSSSGRLEKEVDTSDTSSGRLEKEVDTSDKLGAFRVCKEAVKTKLKAPETATFRDPMGDKVQYFKDADGTVQMDASVDLQNAYGAKLRTTYACAARKVVKAWGVVGDPEFAPPLSPPLVTPGPLASPSASASSCNAAREALLTGTATDIATALYVLQADRSANATAREYADYYLHRDAGDTTMRQADVGLIRMACS